MVLNTSQRLKKHNGSTSFKTKYHFAAMVLHLMLALLFVSLKSEVQK